MGIRHLPWITSKASLAAIKPIWQLILLFMVLYDFYLPGGNYLPRGNNYTLVSKGIYICANNPLKETYYEKNAFYFRNYSCFGLPCAKAAPKNLPVCARRMGWGLGLCPGRLHFKSQGRYCLPAYADGAWGPGAFIQCEH